MANSMQNITNEIFMDALPFIWVRVWNKLTKKSTRDMAANNYPLPGYWFQNSRQ
jgi:hypothetical protein